MIKYIIPLLIYLTTLSANAQYSEILRTARPGNGVGPFTVGKNVFQFQTGIQYDQSRGNNDQNSSSLFSSQRFGITETFELRAAFEIRNQQLNFNENTNSGLSKVIVGIRANVTNNAGTNKPSIGFQFNVNTNIANSEYKSQDLAPSALLIIGKTLSDKFSLGTVWGIGWSGDKLETYGTYVIGLSYSLSERVGLLIENYGSVQSQNFDTNFDFGLSYLINNNLLWDLNFGGGDNDGTSNFFLTSGISWRILTKERE